ncbi:transmembrane protein, putative [Medicago truncatula]|uniref:Transmembrane protein, putative n=1 Tax=Medicago truncatula TaxID=3880 RepID=G7I6M7_MEDTR|nr:transmembrane protein, putative [Medicago truncatula]
MVVNGLKKGITMMMMMLVIMLVVTQVCGATQSLDMSTDESTDQYCHECKNKSCKSANQNILKTYKDLGNTVNEDSRGLERHYKGRNFSQVPRHHIWKETPKRRKKKNNYVREISTYAPQVDEIGLPVCRTAEKENMLMYF